MRGFVLIEWAKTARTAVVNGNSIESEVPIVPNGIIISDVTSMSIAHKPAFRPMSIFAMKNVSREVTAIPTAAKKRVASSVGPNKRIGTDISQ